MNFPGIVVEEKNQRTLDIDISGYDNIVVTIAVIGLLTIQNIHLQLK